MELNLVIAVGEPRATILLLHGYAEHSGRYSSLIEVFAEAGYDVYAYDQPAHGAVDEPRGRVDVAELIRLHRRARQQVEEEMRTESLILFGHSMGGLVTAASALIDPTNIAAVILSGPAFRQYPDVPGFLTRLGYRLAAVLPGMPAATIDSNKISRDPEVVEKYRNDPLVFLGRVPLLSGTSMKVHGMKALDNAGLWPADLPLFVLHGGDDAIANLDGSREFVAAARGARAPAELITVPGGYHEVLKDPGHEELERQIVDWLDKQILSGPGARA